MRIYQWAPFQGGGINLHFGQDLHVGVLLLLTVMYAAFLPATYRDWTPIFDETDYLKFAWNLSERGLYTMDRPDSMPPQASILRLTGPPRPRAQGSQPAGRPG